MLRVIIVDDSEEDLLLCDRLLRQCKLLNPFSLFQSGRHCIEHIERLQLGGAPQPPEPAIIFLDLVMGQTSGLDFLRYLQAQPYAKHSVVVMLSGLKDIKAINEGYQLGAKTFLLKPITRGDIVQLINNLTDKVTIEALETGYLLHWKERVTPDTSLFHKHPRLMSHSA